MNLFGGTHRSCLLMYADALLVNVIRTGRGQFNF